MTKTAVVLFNLGGPDELRSVKPFLFNLFNDRAIIGVPQPLRWLLAKFMSSRRAAKVKGGYQHMGGKSPLLELTTVQAEALEKKLKERGSDYKTFVCMRYWHPMSKVVVKKVRAYAPDHIILLPLYPQFSTTTTESSFDDWAASCKKEKLEIPTTAICCYPTDRGFVAAHAKVIRDMYWKAAEDGKPRVLFSAHGLPEIVVAKGDPYQWQIEKTVAAIRQVMAIDDLDYQICYQSKVGPLEWIGPSTDEEIIRAGKDKTPVLIVPVSFVSEHSETLVELDLDYRTLANKCSVPGYWRVPALGVEEFFIDALADLCTNADRSEKICSFNKERFCTRTFARCPCAA